MKKMLILLLAAVMALSFAACSNSSESTESSGSGSSDTVVWKLGLTNPESHPTAVAANEMADYIYEKTDGRYKIEVYPSSQLGNENDLIESVQMGNIQFCFTATTAMANYVSELGALDMPFVIESEEHADKAIYDENSEAAKKLTEAIDNAGFKTFCFSEQGFRNLMSNKPVASIDDLKGLKVRTMENPLHLELWEALGASPVPLASSDALSAFQQGTVDAVEMANAHLVTVGFAEVGSYYTKTNHLYTVGLYTMNKECYDSLSDEDKAIFDEAAELCQQRCNELNREQDEEYLEQIKGMDNVKDTFEIPVSDMEPLVQSVYDAHPEFNETIELIKSYR